MFYFALQRSSRLQQLLVKTSTAVTVGLVFGAVIWAGMRYIVVPLSAAGNCIPTTFDSNTLAMLVGHAVLLGLPAVLIMRRSVRC